MGTAIFNQKKAYTCVSERVCALLHAATTNMPGTDVILRQGMATNASWGLALRHYLNPNTSKQDWLSSENLQTKATFYPLSTTNTINPMHNTCLPTHFCVTEKPDAKPGVCLAHQVSWWRRPRSRSVAKARMDKHVHITEHNCPDHSF